VNRPSERALPPLVPDEIAGVGPYPQPWPDDDRYDPELLRDGDRRNVADRYRYWTLAAIVADLDTHRHDFAVAIENWQYDLNIGSIVRTANAFLAAEVVIVGRRRWNRRGAMVTERYQHVHEVPTLDDLVAHARATGRELVGIDNTPGSQPLEHTSLPRRALFVFGQEGPGLSAEASAVCTTTLSIAQYGSTRSINAAVAAGIVMHAWIREHAGAPPA
jgi:tRNA G18 (ribose-2'-O)-methylase SpoU